MFEQWGLAGDKTDHRKGTKTWGQAAGLEVQELIPYYLSYLELLFTNFSCPDITWTPSKSS